MSFNQNGQRRYGHVPPAQYGAQPVHNNVSGLQRQSSFDNGDDSSFFDNGAGQSQSQSAAPPIQRAASDELYMGNANAAYRSPTRTSMYSGPALSGYQHQYQPQNAAAPTPTTTYNPQHFARTYSQQLPSNPYGQSAYNSSPPVGYGTQSQPQSYATQAPQPYNPAAYQPQAPIQRQSTISYAQTPVYQTPITSQSAHYWTPSSQYNPSPPVPQRPFEQVPQLSLPYIPASSAPLPARPSAYTPPQISAPYPPNGSGFQPQVYAPPPNPAPPYPVQNQIPAANSYNAPLDDQRSYSDRVSRSSSHVSSQVSTPPIPAEQTNTSGLQRHPTLRPLPNTPAEDSQVHPVQSDDDVDSDSDWDENAEKDAQEQIYRDIENSVSGHARQGSDSRTGRANRQNGDLLHSELGDLHRYNSTATNLNSARGGSTASTSIPSTYNYDDLDDSDAEAQAGLEAMRLAEEQDARRGSGGFGLYESSQQSIPKIHEELSSDSDYANVDMGLYGGGYDARMSYGGDDLTTIGGNDSEMDDQSRPLPTTNELHRNDGHEAVPGLGGMTDYAIPLQTTLHPFPTFDTARVDTYGTGGFQRPTSQGHRMSFDEGDERASIGSRLTESRLSGRSGSESPSRDDFPEMFYHPGMSSSTQRPLPAVPSLQDNRIPQLQPVVGHQNQSPYLRGNDQEPYRPPYAPDGPDAYMSQDMLTPNGQLVPRSASLSSHSSTPQVVPPTRSRTDAEERQARQRALRGQQGIPGSTDGYDGGAPPSGAPVDLPTLPLGRRRKITPSSLRSADFKKCVEPWALSNVAEWIRDMCGGETGEGESDLREKTIIECLIELFTHKVSTMNTADAETLSSNVVKSMFEAGMLIRDEEWVKFGPGTMSGVMWQLTGSGCYAPKVHEQEISGRCYSHHCSRTLKKINLNAQALEPSKKSEDWITFFKLTKPQIDAADDKEIKRQFNLHEVVMTEDSYTNQLDVLRILYRDELQSWQPPIIAPTKLSRFITAVFGKVEAVKKVNEDYLLKQLKYCQQEEGPWISGFSNIFREWIRKARQVYIEYAAGYSNAQYMMRRESERNLLFRQFLEQAQQNKLSGRLNWNTFLIAPLKRLQQYPLLLKEVLKHSYVDNEEKSNLAVAIEEIEKVTLECDAKVDEMGKKVMMLELNNKIYLRPGMERVELNLDHLGRQLIFQGDLQRAGANRFTWLEIHAILFDHYFVMAKLVVQRDAAGVKKKDIYDVSKLPIPMELLVLESANDEPVQKSSVKGLGAVTTVTRSAGSSTDVRLTRPSTNSERPNLEHTNTGASTTSQASSKLAPSTNLEGDAKAMFPFRIKHLGKTEVYTLYAPTAQNRQDWCDRILIAKERHAASLFAQNAEPFRLKVMADTSFAYDGSSSRGPGIKIKGTPLDRAIREMEREYGGVRPSPVCRAMVNCATTFNCFGKNMVAIGTDYGVYTSEASNPRGWTRAIQISRVTQIAILEDFSLCLIIADKSLIAYHLDVIVPVSNFPGPHNDSARRAPQKLSGARDVGFFATARMKDRTLVFYKKREGISSTFKVLEPVFQKSTEKKTKLFTRTKLSGSNTEFFREFDEFYIPTECFHINLFHTYIAVSTTRGFELLTLDRKTTMSIPDLKQPSIANIANRLSGQKPLGMFRKSDTEFLLCYEECGVYVDKHGEVSRSVVLEFIGKAKAAAMYGAYLVLFDSDFVEVRNAENGRLRQVIAGRDVRIIDYGVPEAGNGKGAVAGRTLKVAMAHPELLGSQLVVEMVLNEGQRE